MKLLEAWRAAEKAEGKGKTKGLKVTDSLELQPGHTASRSISLLFSYVPIPSCFFTNTFLAAFSVLSTSLLLSCYIHMHSTNVPYVCT